MRALEKVTWLSNSCLCPIFNNILATAHAFFVITSFASKMNTHKRADVQDELELVELLRTALRGPIRRTRVTLDSLKQLKKVVGRVPSKKRSTKKSSCRVCAAGFTRTTTLRRHLLLKHPVDPNDLVLGRAPMCKKKHFCDICTSGFTRRNDLRTHLITLHDVNPSTLNFVRSQRFKKKHFCDICNSGFTRRNDLRTHLITLHDVNPRTIKLDRTPMCEKKHFCAICNSGFIRRGSLHHHKEICPRHSPEEFVVPDVYIITDTGRGFRFL